MHSGDLTRAARGSPKRASDRPREIVARPILSRFRDCHGFCSSNRGVSPELSYTDHTSANGWYTRTKLIQLREGARRIAIQGRPSVMVDFCLDGGLAREVTVRIYQPPELDKGAHDGDIYFDSPTRAQDAGMGSTWCSYQFLSMTPAQIFMIAWYASRTSAFGWLFE